jgi:hypothetical protein
MAQTAFTAMIGAEAIREMLGHRSGAELRDDLRVRLPSPRRN